MKVAAEVRRFQHKVEDVADLRVLTNAQLRDLQASFKSFLRSSSGADPDGSREAVAA